MMDKTLIQYRHCYSKKYGTFGEIPGLPFPCKTLELPWRGNQPEISCIPEGVYRLVPYDSPKHGPTFCLENEDLDVVAFPGQRRNDRDRFLIEFHSANVIDELLGCVAAGADEGVVFGKWAVTSSAPTTSALLDCIREHEIEYLDIRPWRAEYP